MKPVSGMQGMRSQEIVVGDKERKEERKGRKEKKRKGRANIRQQKEEPDDRKDSRITYERRKTRGKMEWLSRASYKKGLRIVATKGLGDI